MLAPPVSEPRYPGAVAPERIRWIECNGVRLCVHEWGDPAAPPLLLCHGMFDHSRGFDLLAPRLASRFCVLALDARGHGESDWVDTYVGWRDVFDIIRVLHEIGRPCHLVGHSKGGKQATDAAVHAPDCVRKVVNIDGFGPPDEGGFRPPGVPDLQTMSLPERCGLYLDRRREADRRLEWRPCASLDDLVDRRSAQNPRLDRDWLRYFVFHGAHESEEGWRWKADPQTVAGGFGPWKLQWIGRFWRALRAPLLAVIGSVQDTWGPLPEEMLSRRLEYVERLERATVEGAGHFVHMERPAETAALILDFLDSA
jgi:pimeloyl-ACP methyl ester carboxylesterase